MEPAHDEHNSKNPPQEPGLRKKEDHGVLLQQAAEKRGISSSEAMITTTKVSFPEEHPQYTI